MTKAPINFVSSSASSEKRNVAFVAAAFYLLAGILCVLMAIFPAPDLGSSQDMLKNVAAHSFETKIAALIDFIFPIMIVPALLFTAVLIKGRGQVLVYIGVAYALISNLAHPATAAVEYLTVPMSAQKDWSSVTAILQQFMSGQNPLVPFIMVMLPTFGLGLVVVAIGLYRAKGLPLWAMIAVILFMLSSNMLPELVGGILQLLGLCLMAWSLFRLKEPSRSAA